MKYVFPVVGICLVIILFFIFSSCKKETSCEGCINGNKLPIAKAGPNQVITLPTDSVLLDGSASSDPDGTISEWLWEKISGPASYQIRQGDSVRTVVKNLATGSYAFELLVTDNDGLSARDTVVIQVGDPAINRPPVARAGNDTTLFLPSHSLVLNGSGSTDPDNNITAYLWTKLSGPTSFLLANPAGTQTLVSNLAEGTYEFELKVTDSGGLFGKDTVRISVIAPACDNSNRPRVTAQLIPVATLPRPRISPAIAALGNKIFIAGGGCLCQNDTMTARVDIFDLTTQTWSTARLCTPRYIISTAASGGKIFFAGGETGDGTWPVDSVDIYNSITDSWSVAHLSSAGHSIITAALDNKVFFASGDPGFNGTAGVIREKQVDMYNLAGSSWSIAQLSEYKQNCSAAVLGTKVYFAGGDAWSFNPGNNYIYCSSLVDVYDNTTNTWSTITMHEGKSGFASIVVAGKIYWAGGVTGVTTKSNSCLVEIRDLQTGTSSIQYLSKKRNYAVNTAVLANNKIAFFNGDGYEFDIYDISANTWSIGVFPAKVTGMTFFSVNNTIYVGGGYINDALSSQLWELVF